MSSLDRIPFCALVVCLLAANLEAKTTQVDCAKGKSINAALADSDVVEFSGVCAEDVVIRRSHVTLRGISTDAKLIGAPTLPAQPALLIEGADGVILESFAVQNGDGRGVELRGSAAVTIETLAVNGNTRGGLFLFRSSSALVRDSSFDGNGIDGVSVWESSAIVLEGTITANGNVRGGILISNGSSMTMSVFGGTVSAHNNLFGFALQLSGSAIMGAPNPVSVSANGNSQVGVGLSGNASWSGPLTVQNNPTGVEVDASSFAVPTGFSASGGAFGVIVSFNAYLMLRNFTITGNTRGIFIDSGSAELVNANVQGNTVADVRLQFGARAAFMGATSAGTVSCDDTVLIRGTVSCPPPPAAAQLEAKELAPQRPRRQVLAPQ